jgi:diguanylate cyclase (GGDEF)-like protein
VAAEKIRAAMEVYRFDGRSTQPDGKLTVTIGVATFPEDSKDTVELLDLADRALYAGKLKGGNCVSVVPGQGKSAPQGPSDE